MCSWTAQESGGVFPYTYEWKYDNVVVNAGLDPNLWFGDTGSYGEHFLEVRVWDSLLSTAWYGMEVFVDNENANCW